jgi:hypothetical protein
MQEVEGQRHCSGNESIHQRAVKVASSKGFAGEAMKGNMEKEPLILRVDASKLSLQHGA